MGCVHPSVIAESRLLWAHHWEKYTLMPINCKDWLWPPLRISCAGPYHTKQDLLQRGSGTFWVRPLSVLLVEVVGWCFSVIQSCPLGALDLGHPVSCKPRSDQLCSAWGQSSMSYKSIGIWLILTLGMQVPRRGQGANKGQLPLLPDLRPLTRDTGHAKSQMLFVWEILGKYESWAKTGCSHGKATGNSLGVLASLVE